VPLLLLTLMQRRCNDKATKHGNADMLACHSKQQNALLTTNAKVLAVACMAGQLQ
jgi:hypothetical protein